MYRRIEISLAKFKKRKSGPVRDKKSHEKQDRIGADDRPGTEPQDGGMPNRMPDDPPEPEVEKTAEIPPTEKPEDLSPLQQGQKDAKLTQLFWLRVGFAVVAGIAATFIFDFIEGEERRWASIGFMIIVFVATIIIAKGMRIPFSLSDRKKLVTQGIGSYIFMYLFVWIMSYTLVNMNNESTLPFL